jgi:hypothetical protein
LLRHTEGMALSEQLGRVKDGLRGLALTGERRALALLPLCLFGLLYLVLAANAQPGWGPALVGLALAYFVGFFALAAGWFWARWYASGLGWSGFMVGVMAIAMLGWIPALGIYTGLHGLIVGLLLGPKMAERYELRPGWRERFNMDDFGVARLGKAVTRGASALPTLILWALAPREEPAAVTSLLGQAQGAILIVGLVLLVLGLRGLIKLRGFGLLALGGATLAVAVAAGMSLVGLASPLGLGAWALPAPLTPSPTPLLALVLLTAAFSPWARTLFRNLRG